MIEISRRIRPRVARQQAVGEGGGGRLEDQGSRNSENVKKKKTKTGAADG